MPGDYAQFPFVWPGALYEDSATALIYPWPWDATSYPLMRLTRDVAAPVFVPEPSPPPQVPTAPAWTVDDYLRQLQALLPRGAAWPRTADATLTAALRALAKEFARIDDRAGHLIEELDPRSTDELLEDWERVLGLPDACSGPLETVEERRAAVLAKFLAAGYPPYQYITRLAAEIGVPITLSKKVDGDPYKWRVNAPAVPIAEFTCESPCTTPLRSWGNRFLECVVRRRARAHTEVVFGYGG